MRARGFSQTLVSASDVRSTPTQVRPRLLVTVLSVVVLTVAVLQTAVVPILGSIAAQLDSTTVAVSWVVTANLLAAAAATPLIGRAADLYNKKRVLVGVMAVVLIGSILAATTSSLPWLITARVLQGASFALYPICVAVLREELPASGWSEHWRCSRERSALAGVPDSWRPGC